MIKVISILTIINNVEIVIIEARFLALFENLFVSYLFLS